MARRSQWVVVAVVVVVAAVAAWLVKRPHGRSTASSPGAMVTPKLGTGHGAIAPIAKHLVTGHVVLDGRPIAAALLIVGDGGEPGVRIATAADGRFALELAANVYWLRGIAASVTGPGTRVDLRDGDRKDVVVVVHACTRELVGLVTDSSGGAPIAGARIDGGLAITDKHGQFALCDMNGQTEIGVEAGGFASASRHLMPGDTAVDFALVPEAALSGTVVGPDREPIANAAVYVNPSWRTNRDFAQTRNVGGRATTDGSGAFAFRGLGAGAYDVSASAPGFVVAAPITTTVTATTPQLVVAMRVADTIRGVALAGGRPVANAHITWMPAELGLVVSTTRADGTFEMHDTHFGKGAFVVEHYRVVRDVTAGPDPVRLDLEPAMEIRGRVLHDGAPVAGAEVSGAGVPAISDEDGRYVAQVLGPGTVQLVATSEAVGGFSSPKPVVVQAGQAIDGIDLDIAFIASASGTVVDQHGAPIGRATVELDNEEANDVGGATTRDDGTFRVTKLSGGRGSYAISIKLDGHVLAPIGPAASVAVPDAHAAATDVHVAVTLVRAKLAGKIVDDRGAAVPDALIETNGLATRSDADGTFAFEVVDAKPYTLHVAGPPGMRAIVDAMPNSDIKIVLHDPGSVHVTCAAGDGDVRLVTATMTVFEHVACGGTANDVPVGVATATATSGAMGQATVQSGKVAELAVAHQPVRDVAVHVMHASAPVAGATCRAGETMGTTDAAGTAVVSMPRLQLRVSCASLAATASATVDASADSVAVQLP